MSVPVLLVFCGHISDLLFLVVMHCVVKVAAMSSLRSLLCYLNSTNRLIKSINESFYKALDLTDDAIGNRAAIT